MTSSYEGTEQLFISVGKAYIIAAAMEFWGIKDLTAKATKNLPPKNIMHKQKAVKQQFLDEVIGKFVDQYVFHDPDEEIIARYEGLKEHAMNASEDHAYMKDSNPGLLLKMFGMIRLSRRFVQVKFLALALIKSFTFYLGHPV